MIAIRKLSWFVLIILAAALTACGSDDNGTPAPSGGGGGGGAPQSVELDQLAGTWFGTFIGGSEAPETFQFDINGAQITNVQLGGSPIALEGNIIERADEVAEGQRVFRFDATIGSFNPNGILIIDPSATYLMWVYTNGQFGVLQKGATEMPAEGFTADAIAGTWAGMTVRAPTVMDEEAPLSPVEQVNSSAECTTNADDDTSECAISIGDVSKTASALTLEAPALGFWNGSYEGEAEGSARALLSADSNFTGMWACTGLPDGFPENCDFSTWTKGSE